MDNRKTLSSDEIKGLDISRHAIGWDHIILYQPIRGYRMAIDSLLLAWFTRQFNRGYMVELGCGPGFVSLCCARDDKVERVVGIDCNASMIELASQSAAANGLELKTSFLVRDIRSSRKDCRPGFASLIVMNPPYRKLGTGKTSPVLSRAMANHEVTASMKDFLEAAAWLLKSNGSITAVFLCERMAEFLSVCRELKLEPKNIRFIHAFAQRKSKIFLIRSVKNGHPGLTIEPPLILYEAPGKYTAEVQSIIGH